MARIVLLLALWCSAVAATAASLRIAVASSFQPAMTRLTATFEQATGIEVAWQIGSSGSLYQHIRMGAAFDLFLSADSQRPRLLENQGLTVQGSRKTYALGRLAWWQPGSPANTPPDLARLRGRLAMANPRLAPYGVAAEAVLTRLGGAGILSMAPALAPNIAQAYQFVASGNAVAGLLAVAQLKAFQVTDGVWIVPADWYPRICQQAVAMRTTKAATAKRFQRFLASAPARAILQSLGYGLPPAENQGGTNGC